MEFSQNPPHLGNQFSDDGFLQSLLCRLLPPEALPEVQSDLGEAAPAALIPRAGLTAGWRSCGAGLPAETASAMKYVCTVTLCHCQQDCLPVVPALESAAPPFPTPLQPHSPPPHPPTHPPVVERFGWKAATTLKELGQQAEAQPPRLVQHDAWGGRIDAGEMPGLGLGAAERCSLEDGWGCSGFGCPLAFIYGARRSAFDRVRHALD